MKKILIIGGGGHAKVVIDAVLGCGRYSICGIIDNKLKPGTSVMGIKVLGGDSALEGFYEKGVRHAFIGVGSIGDCEVRKNICKRLKKTGFSMPVVIHNKAVIGKDVYLGNGTFIAAGVIVNPGSAIGENAIINTSASVDHDCVVGDFVHIAPGAVLSGGVRVGKETHIGAGATVIQNITIGEKTIVGAGTTVRHDVSSKTIYKGGR